MIGLPLRQDDEADVQALSGIAGLLFCPYGLFVLVFYMFMGNGSTAYTYMFPQTYVVGKRYVALELGIEACYFDAFYRYPI